MNRDDLIREFRMRGATWHALIGVYGLIVPCHGAFRHGSDLTTDDPACRRLRPDQTSAASPTLSTPRSSSSVVSPIRIHLRNR